VCKTASFFAAYPEMELPEGQTGAVAEPDWGGGGYGIQGRVSPTVHG